MFQWLSMIKGYEVVFDLHIRLEMDFKFGGTRKH
jgi:hypothetical protein